MLALGAGVFVGGVGALGPRAGGDPVRRRGGPAVTPKTEAPNEARALSRAFSNVAKALGPSVVRIEVEVGAPRAGADWRGQGRPQMPDDENDMSPFFRRFFDFGGGGGGMPQPGPQHGVGSGFIIDTNGDIVTNRHVVQGAPRSPSP